jgi:hypothetical protein
MTAEQKRTQLLEQLKAAGVKAPATMYPKRDMWTDNTTPDDMFDRMQAHLIQLQQDADYQEQYGKAA